MRHWFVFSVALLALTFSPNAEAGKKSKKDKGESTEQSTDAAAEETEGIVIQDTGVADIDALFAKAKAPVDTITNTRLSIDKINTDLATALGLTEGTPFADAIADLSSKAEGKISFAVEEGKAPTFSAEEGVPENVQAASDALNSGLDELMKAADGLAELPDQFTALADEAKSFADVNKLTSMGVKPLEAPKVVKKVNTNLKSLSKAPEEAKMLVDSLASMKDTLTSAFPPAAPENACAPANPCGEAANPCGGE